jgi:formylglycine-generating enzyme required for sulfatase activity
MLRGILEKNPPALGVDLRQRLGLALGEIGDPRFPVSIRNKTKVIFPEMISIPAVVFRMGTSEENEKAIKEQGAQIWDDEKPAHSVSLSEYSIGKYLVTNAEYRCFYEQGGYNTKAEWWSEDGRKWRTGAWEPDFSWLPNEDLKKQWKDWLAQRPVSRRDCPFYWDDPKWNGANLPVVGITWFEMEAYCNWLTHVAEKYFRLPTEAEWEHAARGTEELLWAWGNEWDSDKANTDEAEKKIAGTSPVGLYPHGASSYGIEDMSGNVWEWCSDWYSEDEYRNRKDGIQDPRGPEKGRARVVRGGSWNDNRNLARCSYRGRREPDFFYDVIGFRVVCSPIIPISEL